jgi:hypothetical protein
MKQLVKVEGLEKEAIVMSCYNGSYVADQKSRNPEHYERIMNSHLIYKTTDGIYVSFDSSKRRICTDLWFSDDRDIPEESEALFVAYNLRTNGSSEIDVSSVYCFRKYAKHEGHDIACVSKTGWVDDDDFARYLTEEERNEVKAILDSMNAEYTDRLKKYWKRYSKHVMTRGYWADR